MTDQCSSIHLGINAHLRKVSKFKFAIAVKITKQTLAPQHHLHNPVIFPQPQFVPIPFPEKSSIWPHKKQEKNTEKVRCVSRGCPCPDPPRARREKKGRCDASRDLQKQFGVPAVAPRRKPQPKKSIIRRASCVRYRTPALRWVVNAGREVPTQARGWCLMQGR